MVWLGSQVLKAVRKNGAWEVEHHRNGSLQRAITIDEKGVLVGRGSGESRMPEIILDEGDTFLSRRHAQLRFQDDRLTVLDLKSKNGTFIRVTAPVQLENGDVFHAGGKNFRFDLAPSVEPFEAEAPAPAPAIAAKPVPAAKTAAPQAVAPPAGGAAVVIDHPQHAVSFPVASGQTVLDAFLAYLKERYPDESPDRHRKKPLNWECKGGTCGLCAVHIIEGAENFTGPPADSEELNTLNLRADVDPDPKQYRLTCKAMIGGPVRLALIE
jgi:ferredoxin